MLNLCLNFNELHPKYVYKCYKKECSSTVFKYFNDRCPSNYLNEVFGIAPQNNFQTRSSFQKLTPLPQN